MPATKKKYLKGQLLLDGGKLQGSYFHRSVVLICQHDAEGAFGLVLNKVSKHKVGESLVADLPNSLREQVLYLGGPVQQGALSYLHTDACLLNANVIPNLNLGHSIEELAEASESYSSTSQLRVFAGYAGWSPGQLESEMNQDAWLTHPASLDLVFDEQPETLWKKVLALKGWQYRLLSEAPEDPSLN